MVLMEETDERYAEPELHRLRGELLKVSDAEEAERSIAKAVEVSRHQSSKSLELRAAMSLHRFHRGAKKGKALESVRRVFEGFTEGFDTADLRDAKAMLSAS
jgi:predicted ATPase